MALTYHSSRTHEEREALLKSLKKIAKETSNQYAQYYYLYTVGKATLYQLYRAYNEITGRRIRLATLRKQLKILEERYKVVKRKETSTHHYSHQKNSCKQ